MLKEFELVWGPCVGLGCSYIRWLYVVVEGGLEQLWQLLQTSWRLPGCDPDLASPAGYAAVLQALQCCSAAV